MLTVDVSEGLGNILAAHALTPVCYAKHFTSLGTGRFGCRQVVPVALKAQIAFCRWVQPSTASWARYSGTPASGLTSIEARLANGL